MKKCVFKFSLYPSDYDDPILDWKFVPNDYIPIDDEFIIDIDDNLYEDYLHIKVACEALEKIACLNKSKIEELAYKRGLAIYMKSQQSKNSKNSKNAKSRKQR